MFPLGSRYLRSTSWYSVPRFVSEPIDCVSSASTNLRLHTATITSLRMVIGDMNAIFETGSEAIRLSDPRSVIGLAGQVNQQELWVKD